MTTRSFLGIPVDGDIVQPDRRAKQRPLEEFSPLIQAVLDDPYVQAFGWHQYTPYFNDGEPCVFSAYDLWVGTVDDAPPVRLEEPDDEDRWEEEGPPLEGHPQLAPRRWNGSTYEPFSRSPERTLTYQRCRALADAIESGEFDNVLLEAFGDHATVTVKRSGITIGSLSHE